MRAYCEERLDRDGELSDSRDRHLEHYIRAFRPIHVVGWYMSRTEVVDWDHQAANLEAAVDWAMATMRYRDAAEMLVRGKSLWRERPDTQRLFERCVGVREALSDTDPMYDEMLIPMMHLLMLKGTHEEILANTIEMGSSAIDSVRAEGLAARATSLCLSDPEEALNLVSDLHLGSGWDVLTPTYVDLLDGNVESALSHGLVAEVDNYVINGTVAAMTLMSGEPHATLDFLEDKSAHESVWRPYGITIGLSHLALGDREKAERRLLDEARGGALGRIPSVANSALVGMAALVAERGDAEWARAIILGAGMQRTMAIAALARDVAAKLGVRDEFVEQQVEASMLTDGGDATPLLVETPRPLGCHLRTRLRFAPASFRLFTSTWMSSRGFSYGMCRLEHQLRTTTAGE